VTAIISKVSTASDLGFAPMEKHRTIAYDHCEDGMASLPKVKLQDLFPVVHHHSTFKLRQL